jgi:hypothetical protein
MDVEEWTKRLVAQSTLGHEQKVAALKVALKSGVEGGLRGDVSDALRGAGFTNEQFNFELFV